MSRSNNIDKVDSNYVLTFGKHNGVKLCNVLINDPSYILWLNREGILLITEDLLDEANSFVDEMDNFQDDMSWGDFEF